MALNPWVVRKPHPRQQRFLLHSFTREAMYGGAGGGGKSVALLSAAAQYVDVPGYSALLLRSSFPDLVQPEALIPRSKEWWMGTGATWNEQQKRWTFPSGATLTFGYLGTDNDVYQYQGAAYQFIGVDELTQHTEFRYSYLNSRLRRPSSGPLSRVPARIRSASNPGGVGHDWVYKRFIDERTRAAGAVFVPAKLTDNPSLDVADYRANLAHLDPLTRAQIEGGDWEAVQGGRFRREWLKRYQLSVDGMVVECQGQRPVPLAACMRFATVDVAASVKDDADYTVICSWAVTPRKDLVWLDCVRGRWEVPDIVPKIREAYRKWNLTHVGVEGGGTQKAAYQMLCRTEMVARELIPGAQDKLMRATPAIIMAEAGRLYLPRYAPWLADAEGELIRFTGDPHKDSQIGRASCRERVSSPV